jgi:copper resistance protein B
MKALLILLLAGVATPALAQHSGHAAPAAPAAGASCTPEHAAMGHCTPPPPPAQPEAQAVDPHAGHEMPDEEPQAADPHAGHQMPDEEEQPVADPHAGHEMPAEEQQPVADPHAGHQMPAEQQPAADPHAGHRMGSAPQPPEAPPPPAALAGPEHAADTVYDPQRMAASREEMRRMHGDMPAYRFFIERAETRIRDGRYGYVIDGQAWYGGDIDKVWFKGEVEGAWGENPEHAEIQALWSHAIDPWFDLQTGVRYDPQPGPDRAHLVLGVQGLAPYWWEVDGALFLSNKGEITARAEAEYDLRITQKLILQPRGELDFSLQDIPELGIGAGLSQAAIGARLRYQVSPLVAPYVGVEYERALGDTADFRRDEGEDAGGWNLLAGIRFWF